MPRDRDESGWYHDELPKAGPIGIVLIYIVVFIGGAVAGLGLFLYVVSHGSVSTEVTDAISIRQIVGLFCLTGGIVADIVCAIWHYQYCLQRKRLAKLAEELRETETDET